MADEGEGEGEGLSVNKAGRLPRWSRQELLVLIQGKRMAENRVGRRGTAESSLEPKWSSVSSYCKRHGVNRGPVQCRKRWSNLAGDFKKIKEWESSNSSDDSFWVMRNDFRRQRKLPGFFDREVYDILLHTPTPPNLILEHVFDSNNNNNDDAPPLFSDNDPSIPIPISATQPPPPPPPPAADDDDDDDKEPTPTPSPETYQGNKRKRLEEEETLSSSSSLQKQLIEAMERNGRLLTSQLEIQNNNSQLDREQRKDDANTLFALLNKLADAMVRIADKL
ncbi:hypothetical protein QVD17_42235 [Tagetes erecta]|uniref:Myb-like domain-containing protein n=1 Tax=Tagetes erecta TaxID=13708 RepID=A0AAD8NFI3_TARER|nr:hypothetical protein QVD17_42235 [Tagetes erecta]